MMDKRAAPLRVPPFFNAVAANGKLFGAVDPVAEPFAQLFATIIIIRFAEPQSCYFPFAHGYGIMNIYSQ